MPIPERWLGHPKLSLRSTASLVFAAVLTASLTLTASAVVVHGTVTDPLGAAITGATVGLFQGGKIVTTARTGSDGGYTLSYGPVGRFFILAGGSPFKQVATHGFYGGRLDDIRQDVVLELDTVQQNIIVTATGIATTQAQTAASVDVLHAAELQNRLDLIDPLRQVSGVNIVSNGQFGSVTSVFVRGGNSNANKITIDGVPAEDTGGRFDLGNVSTTGIEQVEAFRGPNSSLFGSDAAAGVFAITTPRGSTPAPSLLYEGTAGNRYTYRNEVEIGGAHRKLDYFGGFSRLNSSNDLPQSEYHNITSSLNLGWSPSATTQIRGTARNATIALGLPGPYDFYKLANDQKQSDQDLYVSASIDNQTSEMWHNLVRYGLARKREQARQWYPAGNPVSIDFGFGLATYYFGNPVLIKGANGYSVTGEAILNYPGTYPNASDSDSNRDQLYFQSDYRITPHVVALLGFRFEDERGSYNPYYNQSIERQNYDYTAQIAGDLKNRFFYQLGGGVQKNQIYGTEGSPRIGVAYYIRRPGQGIVHGTKLAFNFSKGVREPALGEQFGSLYETLLTLPGGPDAIRQARIGQVGAARTRSYDGGVEQSFFSERVLFKTTYFHNEFGDQIEYVGGSFIPALLPNLSPQTAAQLLALLQYTGAYINSLSFSAQGIESQVEYQPITHVFLRGGYTYLDTKVQHSFSSDATGPSFNTGLPNGAPPSFSNIPIGIYSPLRGARPFRRPPHTGFFSATYSDHGFAASLNAAFAGTSDDSTYLGYSDIAGGNSLILPNRNLDHGYAKLDLGLSYQITKAIAVFTETSNLLNQSHIAPIGYPSTPLLFRSGLRLAIGGHSK